MLVIFNWVLWLLCYLIVRKYVTARTYPRSIVFDSKEYVRFFTLVLLFSLFTFFGGDIKNDKEMVEGGFKAAAYSDFFSIEKIYVIFAQYSFGFLLLWKLYVYGLCILVTMLTLNRMGRKDSHSLLFYTLMFLPSMGATRSVLAFSVFILAVYMIVEGTTKDKIVGFLLLISTYLLHSSMILPILLFFISKLRLNRVVVAVFVVSVPIISSIINNNLMPYLENNPAFMASQVGYKYEQYINNEDVTFDSSLPLRIFNYATYIFLSLCIYFSVTAGWKKKLSNFSTRIVSICFFLAYIASVIALCDFQNSDLIARRFISIDLFILFIVMPELIQSRHLSWAKSWVVIGLGFLRVNWFFAMMLWNEIS